MKLTKKRTYLTYSPNYQTGRRPSVRLCSVTAKVRLCFRRNDVTGQHVRNYSAEPLPYTYVGLKFFSRKLRHNILMIFTF